MGAVIKVEKLSKQYRLGDVGTGSLRDDFKRFRYRLMGKEDPFLKIGEENDRTKKSGSDYVWALRDINFEVQQGDVVGIIGRNGAGKSTLLKILSRTTAPTTGSVKVRGRIASLLEVGTGFHGELSGRENIYLNGAIMGLRKWEIDKKLDEIIDFAGVEKYLDTPVKRYSSGMYVRLAFAVAAHLEPDILIVDEVLAVGDAEFQKKCLGKMKDVSEKQGRTVLFVSHNMSAIKNLCNSGILMTNGKITSVGAIYQVLNDYLNINQHRILVDINERKDRIGNRELKFTDVVFLNKRGEEQQTFMSGDEMSIVLRYKTQNNQPLKRVSVSLALNNKDDLQVAVLGNEISNQLFEEIEGKGEFICNINKIQLVSGIYNLNLFAKVGEDIADWIINTCSLTIEKSDYYKTGKNADAEQSIFLMDYNFQVNSK